MTVLGTALCASTAGAATVTIGSINPFAHVVTPCSGSDPSDQLQPTVTFGPSYVVPAGGARVTSWITNAGIEGAGNGQEMTMKIFRRVSDVGPTYKVVGHDGPRLLATGLNTFQTNIAVQPGDVLGLNPRYADATAPEACTFGQPGESRLLGSYDLSDGTESTFTPVSDYRLNIEAVVELAPGAKPTGASAFSFGKVKDNKKKGTATITVNVPGPGTVDLTGKGVKNQRSGGAIASKVVSAAGPVKLLVKPKGKVKHKLAKKGKVKVKVSVTYTPAGGNAATQSERVKLIKKH